MSEKINATEQQKTQITFVVQNKEHALNYIPVIDQLIATGVNTESINIICLDNQTGMKTQQELNGKATLLPLASSIPFYRMTALQRIRFLLKNRKTIRDSVKNTRQLVIGNDGAIQRLMMKEVLNSGGKTFMMLDGFLLPRPTKPLASLKFSFKLFLFKFGKFFGIDYLFPSEIGHSELNEIYVMHSNVKQILLDQNIRNNIQVITMPRFLPYAEAGEQAKQNAPDNNQFLYATSAYQWHGLTALDQGQQLDINDFILFAKNRPDDQFRIRIHPRENESDYNKLNLPDNLELTNSKVPSMDDLIWSTCLITPRSTMAIEGLYLGKPVYIYTKNIVAPGENMLIGDQTLFHHISALSQIVDNTKQPAKHALLNTTDIKVEIANFAEKISGR